VLTPEKKSWTNSSKHNRSLTWARMPCYLSQTHLWFLSSSRFTSAFTENVIAKNKSISRSSWSQRHLIP
jgi:hypothetical protein